MIRWLVTELKSIIDAWRTMNECELKRQEWYRSEIIKALEEKDFRLAAILEQEMKKNYWEVFK